MVRLFLLVCSSAGLIAFAGCASFDVTAPSDDVPAVPADSGAAADGPTQGADASPIADAQPALDAPQFQPFCDPSDSDLIACFDFDTQTGADGSSYGHDLTLDDVGFRAGIAGSAINLDLGSIVSTSATSDFDIAAMTIEMWIRPTAAPTSNRMGLFDKNFHYSLFWLPNGQIRCTGGGVFSTSYDIPLDAWTHLACTHDGSRLTLWINGTEQTSISAQPLDDQGFGSDVTVGMNAPSGDNFIGAIDNVRLWQVARSAEELCTEAGDNCVDP